MGISSIEYGYGPTDTSVDVMYVEDEVERTVIMVTVMSNGAVDFDATEAAIKTSIYGDEEPPAITPVELED